MLTIEKHTFEARSLVEVICEEIQISNITLNVFNSVNIQIFSN